MSKAMLIASIRQWNEVINNLDEDTMYEALVKARLAKHILCCKLRALCRQQNSIYDLQDIVK